MAAVSYFTPAELAELGQSTLRTPAAPAPAPLPAVPPRSYFSEGIESGVEGLKSAGYGLLAAGARGLGMKDAEAAAVAAAQEHAKNAGANAMRVEDVKTPGDALGLFKYGLGSALPSMATMAAGAIGGGALGRMLTKNALNQATRNFASTMGVAAGGMGASTGIEVGSIFPEAVETGVENPGTRALAGGFLAGALDTIAPALIARRFGVLGKKFGEAGIYGQGGFGGAAKTAAADVGKVMATEAPTEAAQSLIERVAAGKPSGDAEAVSEYINSAVLALPMGVLGAPGGAVRGYRGPQMAPEEAPAEAPATATAAAPTATAVTPEAVPATAAAPAVAQEAPAGTPAVPPAVTPPAAPTATAVPETATAVTPVAKISPIGTPFASRDDALVEQTSIQQRIADLQNKDAWKARKDDLTSQLTALQAERKLPKGERRPVQDIQADMKRVKAAADALGKEVKAAPAEIKNLQARMGEISTALSLMPAQSGINAAGQRLALDAERSTLVDRIATLESTIASEKELSTGVPAKDLAAMGKELKAATARRDEIDKTLNLVGGPIAPAQIPGDPAAGLYVQQDLNPPAVPQGNDLTVAPNAFVERSRQRAELRKAKNSEIDKAYEQLNAAQQKQKARELRLLLNQARDQNVAAAQDQSAADEAVAAAAGNPEGAMAAALRKAGLAPVAEQPAAAPAPELPPAPPPPADLTARMRMYEVWKHLKAGNTDGLTEEDLSQAVERGPTSVKAPALKELMLRLEEELAFGESDARQVRSDQEVPVEAGQVDQGSQVDGGGNLQQAPEAGQQADDPVLREQDKRVRSQVRKLGGKNDPLIKWIIARGGIDSRYAEDITGEKAFKANHLAPGLFKKPRHSATSGQQIDGWGLDEIAIAAGPDGEGFIAWDEYTDTGGVATLTKAIQNALNRKSRNVRFSDEEEEFRQVMASSDAIAARDEAEKLGVDLSEAKTAEEAWDMIDRAAQIKAMAEVVLPAQEVDNQDLIVRAAEIDEDAVERASIATEGDDAAFMVEIRRIIDEYESQAVEGSEAAAEVPAPGARGAEQAAGGEPLLLQGQTPEEVAAQEAARVAAEKKSKTDDAAEREEAVRQEIAQRSEAAAADFQLGQSADDNLSGQEGLFARSGIRPEDQLLDPGTIAGKDVIDLLDRMLGGTNDVEIRLFDQRDPFGFAGRYTSTPYKDVIEIAYNARDMLSVGAHEGFHRIEKKHLSKAEQAILSRGLRPNTALYKRVKELAAEYDEINGSNIASEMDVHPMEVHAYAYQFWFEGKLQPGSAIDRVFQKIRDFLEKVRNFIDGYGFSSVEQIFDAVNRGMYAKHGNAFIVDATRAYNAIDREVLQSRGALQGVGQTGTHEFKAWFGSSKLVDAEGNPLVLYHATASDFKAFKPGGNNPDLSGRGIWMTPNKENQPAAHNTRMDPVRKNRVLGKGRFTPGTRVMPLYANISRPLILDETTKEWAKEVFGSGLPFILTDETLKEVKDAGYDGVLWYDKGALSEVIAFEPTQVKSAVGNVGTFLPDDPDILHSYGGLIQQSMAELVDNAKNGQGGYTALMHRIGHEMNERPMPEKRAMLGAQADQWATSLKDGYLVHFSSGNNLSKNSNGFKNVFDVLTRHSQRKNRLISDNLEVGLSKWLPWARAEAAEGESKGAKITAADVEAASNALMERTSNNIQAGTNEYQKLYGALTPAQRQLFDQATAMVARLLNEEFEADKVSMARAFANSPEQYAKWEADRKAQVDQLIRDGYVPERRYGDHAAHVYTMATDEKGNKRKVTLYYSLDEDKADALLKVRELTKLLEDFPDIKVEYGTRFKPEFDASMSYTQFLDMAEANGVSLTQAERERIARSLIAADSARRNRIFRRKNIPGYSKDGTRVLAEFAVNVSNKIAYAEFGEAMNEALRGRKVTTSLVNGKPQIAIEENTDTWAEDGERAGFYHRQAQRTMAFVMKPEGSEAWSRGLRAAAGVNFLGGSVATALVQLSSLPMNVVPNLMKYTGAANAFALTGAAFKQTLANQKLLRSLVDLKDPRVQIPGIDQSLKDALVRAGEDGTTMDTELYQLMGMTRGGMASRSRTVQKAVEAWMLPFRWSEQVNRISTFIAAYRLGQENKLSGEALYSFAQQMVYDTQFRYDEANRPAITRNPVGAVLFTFKSYPIYMMEMITALAKEKPQAAAAMLGMVALAAGINGLPFAEDLMDIIDTIAQRLFNVPFNSKRAIRNLLKNASEAMVGSDWSGVLMNGLINEMTDLNFASRVGLGNLIPGTRAFAKDTDPASQLKDLTGPVGSMVAGWTQGVGSVLQGAGAALTGDLEGAWDGTIKGLREGGPAALKNAIKSGEQFSTGYALDAKGQNVVPVSSWEAFWQGLGFSSRTLGLAYDLDRMDKQAGTFYKEIRSDMVKLIVNAMRDGDQEKITAAFEQMQKWNERYPDMPISPDPGSMRRAIMLAQMPLNQRTMMMLPKHMRAGSIAAEGSVE